MRLWLFWPIWKDQVSYEGEIRAFRYQLHYLVVNIHFVYDLYGSDKRIVAGDREITSSLSFAIASRGRYRKTMAYNSPCKCKCNWYMS